MAEVSSTSESSFAAQVVEDSFAVDRSCDEIAGVEIASWLAGLVAAIACVGRQLGDGSPRRATIRTSPALTWRRILPLTHLTLADAPHGSSVVTV